MSENWLTRQTLLERALNPNDEDAWDDFVKYYYNFIKMVLHQSGYKSSENEDLIQETLVAIWKNLKNFKYDRNRSRFRTWLSRIVKNKLIDFYRKSKTERKAKENIQIENDTLGYLQESELDEFVSVPVFWTVNKE